MARRVAMALGFLGALAVASTPRADAGATEARAGDGGASTSARALERGRFRLSETPEHYEEVDVGGSASAEAFLRDARFGLAANTISVSSKTASGGVPMTLRDIGAVEDVATRVVDGENAASRGRALATLRGRFAREKKGVEYYDVVLEKDVLGVRRVIQITLALRVDRDTGASTLYTVRVETDRARYDANERAYRAVADGFEIF